MERLNSKVIDSRYQPPIPTELVKPLAEFENEGGNGCVKAH